MARVVAGSAWANGRLHTFPGTSAGRRYGDGAGTVQAGHYPRVRRAGLTVSQISPSTNSPGAAPARSTICPPTVPPRATANESCTRCRKPSRGAGRSTRGASSSGAINARRGSAPHYQSGRIEQPIPHPWRVLAPMQLVMPAKPGQPVRYGPRACSLQRGFRRPAQPATSGRRTGACYRALRCLPGRDSHPQAWTSFQDATRNPRYA